MSCGTQLTNTKEMREWLQLVERDLAKVEAAGSESRLALLFFILCFIALIH